VKGGRGVREGDREGGVDGGGKGGAKYGGQDIPGTSFMIAAYKGTPAPLRCCQEMWSL